MRHEIRYALEHAPGLEDEGQEGDFVKGHVDSGELVVSQSLEGKRTRRGPHRRCDRAHTLVSVGGNQSGLWPTGMRRGMKGCGDG